MKFTGFFSLWSSPIYYEIIQGTFSFQISGMSIFFKIFNSFYFSADNSCPFIHSVCVCVCVCVLTWWRIVIRPHLKFWIISTHGSPWDWHLLSFPWRTWPHFPDSLSAGQFCPKHHDHCIDLSPTHGPLETVDVFCFRSQSTRLGSSCKLFLTVSMQWFKSKFSSLTLCCVVVMV